MHETSPSKLPSLVATFSVSQQPTLSEAELTVLAEDACLWLLEHVDEEKPHESALSAITPYWVQGANAVSSTSIMFCRHILCNLLKLVLARPNSYFPVVFDGYWKYIVSYRLTLVSGLKEYDKALGINLGACFKILGADRLKQASTIYSASLSDVLVEAIATDDVDLFKLVCSKPDNGAYPYYKWENLARFEDDLESRIFQECPDVSGVQGQREIYKARASLIRHTLEPQASRRSLKYLSRNAPGSPKTLGIGFQNWRQRESDADTFFRRPEFRKWILANPVDAIKAIYGPSLNLEIYDPQMWALADEVTSIFLDAGARPQDMITYGPLNRSRYGTPVELDEALNYLGHLSDMNFRFYAYIYLAYLRTFTIEQVIEACDDSDLTLLGAYKILRDNRLLQAMGGNGRTLSMAADLGL